MTIYISFHLRSAFYRLTKRVWSSVSKKKKKKKLFCKVYENDRANTSGTIVSAEPFVLYVN